MIPLIVYSASLPDSPQWDDRTYTEPTVDYLVSPGYVKLPRDYAGILVGRDQFDCLDKLWTKESNWNPDAQNRTSTAYGIAQFLNSTWKGTGIEKTDNPYKQIDAGVMYIKSRYKTPCNAWAHSRAKNYY